jgi:hypothetical protein
MTNKFHYEIDSYKIDPIGRTFNYAAKAIIYEDLGKSERIAYTTGEVWGETETKAQVKATKLAKDWIEKQK